VSNLEESWGGDQYHLVRKNCINFAEEFCSYLGVEIVPAWVKRLPFYLANHAGQWEAGFEKFQEMGNRTMNAFGWGSGYRDSMEFSRDSIDFSRDSSIEFI